MKTKLTIFAVIAALLGVAIYFSHRIENKKDSRPPLESFWIEENETETTDLAYSLIDLIEEAKKFRLCIDKWNHEHIVYQSAKQQYKFNEIVQKLENFPNHPVAIKLKNLAKDYADQAEKRMILHNQIITASFDREISTTEICLKKAQYLAKEKDMIDSLQTQCLIFSSNYVKNLGKFYSALVSSKLKATFPEDLVEYEYKISSGTGGNIQMFDYQWPQIALAQVLLYGNTNPDIESSGIE
jgi:hypothetical protein